MKKLTLLLICILPFCSQAQQYEVGAFAGASFYNGDIQPEDIGGYFQWFRPAGGVFGKVYLKPKLSARLGLNIGKLTADDTEGLYPNRGLNFETAVIEVAFTAEYELFKIRYADSDNGISPFVFGGVSAFRMNPKTNLNGTLIELQPLGTEGQGIPGYPAQYSLTQIAIPLGLGVKIDLNDQLVLGLEFGARKLLTDYLDDISNTNIDYQTLRRSKGDLVTQLSNPSAGLTDADFNYQRGGEGNDWFYMTGVTLAYKFGGKFHGKPFSNNALGCPKL